MDLLTIIEQLKTFGLGNYAVLFVVLISLVQIAPIKIDPWSSFIRWIGKILLGEINAKIDSLDKKIDALEKKEDMRDAVNKRVRILRFEDELQGEKRHSKDSFDQVMSDITDYDQYCAEHPKFKNNQTEATVTHIKKVYAERLEKRDFL